MRVLALALIAAACGASKTSQARQTPSGGVIASNMLRGDYAGSQACAECHRDLYEQWAASPMRNMTRDAATAKLRAPFAGETLRVGAETATMTTEGKAHYMRVDGPAGTHRFRITKVIGGRYREDFVGVAEGEEDTAEHVLPATYVFSTKSWRYKGYSVMVPERPRMSWQGVWSRECIPCHNTLPYVTMLYDELYGPGLPGYQGKLSDRLMPLSRTWPAKALDEDGLTRVLDAEIDFLGGDHPDKPGLRAALPAAATAMLKHLDGPHLVEIGVGCEACHNGAREHTIETSVTPSFEPRSRLVGITPPKGQPGTRAQWINRICAKCHTVLFSHYPYTWEGGKRREHPGGSSTNSGEGRDFQLGSCSTQMSCTTCHDPHTADPRDKLAEMGTPAGNKICVSCHTKMNTAQAVEEHTHHKGGSAGSACIACHMAKKNMGLDYGLVRYHRIGSPTEERRVTGDRPLECALCHADYSVEKIVSTMETWWGKHYDRSELQALYGPNLDVNALYATLERGKPHEQAAAIAVLGEAKDRNAIAGIVPHLAHAYPLVRYFAQHALQLITGDPVAIDVGAPAAEVTRAAQAWLQSIKVTAARP